MVNIGITGHRTLNKVHTKKYIKEAKNILKRIQKDYPYDSLMVFSGLADGGDRLAIYAALELNIPFTAVLPFSISEYKTDFAKESIFEFDTLLAKSEKVIELNYNNNQSRDMGYSNLAQNIVATCDYLIAYWDGIYTNKVGGTSDVVKRFMEKKDFSKYKLFIVDIK